MVNGSTAHEVLAVVFQVRGLGPGPKTQKPELNVLLWQRAQDPQRGTWSLPGGRLRSDEDMTTSVRRQLAEKVDLRELAHLEQLAVFSDPHRIPGVRTIASTFLGLVPSPARPPRAPGEQAAADGLRSRSDGRARPHPARRQDVLHEYRICFDSKGIRA